jgi:Tfp pilus assembly protein PilN
MALQLNFARRPFRNYRPINLTVGLSLLLGALLFALNLRDYFAFRSSAAGARREIAGLQSQAMRTREQAERTRASLASMRLKDLQAESLRLNALLGERQFSWTSLLSRLERVLPDDVYVTHLSPQITKVGKDAVGLTCVGKAPESLVRTLAALARDSHFSEPTPESETDPEKGAPEGFRFRLTAAYYPEGRP